MGFAVKTETVDGQLVHFLSGSIDEDVADLPRQSLNQQLILDLDGVSMINSIGIRTWCQWIDSLPPEERVFLRRVPKSVASQINTVKGFLRNNSTVESIHLPLFCDKCDRQSSVLIDCASVKDRDFSRLQAVIKQHAQKNCEQQNCELEPDVNVERYFSFLDINE